MQFEDLPFAAFIDCQATEQRRFTDPYMGL
jgi:hypothetical protein